jgi:hypothetical protein
MRKNSRSGNEARQRASGSTDILAGADTAYAIHRVPPDTIKVECVKSRAFPEPPPFGIRICDDGPDSPVEMQYVQAIEQTGTLGKADRLALDFLVKQTPPVRTAAIKHHLVGGGVAERTAERVMQAGEAGTGPAGGAGSVGTGGGEPCVSPTSGHV